ncbi:MAG: hypothetical protein D6723_10340 [Acidobacteria bacterium]|nr:MAG: hypothetical protein D6723_10340 [Acidobacteriota bacterium]
MSEVLTYPPDAYSELFLTLYEQLNGEDSTGPMTERRGPNYDARIWCSRGEVLEKAGLILMHIRHEDPDGVRLVRHFDTVIHPHNPRVPGFVIVIGQEVTEPTHERRLYCLMDMWRTTRRPDARVVERFRRSIEAVCQDHGRSYAKLNAPLAGVRLFGDNGCGAGIFHSQLRQADIPFLDHLVQCAADEIAGIIESCHRWSPDVNDFQERNEIRRQFLVWALTENPGTRRAVAAGVPWSVFEHFAFPPEVSY